MDHQLGQALAASADGATNDLPVSTICSSRLEVLQNVDPVQLFGVGGQIVHLVALGLHHHLLQAETQAPAPDCQPRTGPTFFREGHLVILKTMDTHEVD